MVRDISCSLDSTEAKFNRLLPQITTSLTASCEPSPCLYRRQRRTYGRGPRASMVARARHLLVDSADPARWHGYKLPSHCNFFFFFFARAVQRTFLVELRPSLKDTTDGCQQYGTSPAATHAAPSTVLDFSLDTDTAKDATSRATVVDVEQAKCDSLIQCWKW